MVSVQNDTPIALYNYTPSIVAAIIFLVLFSLLTIGHSYLVIKSRVWWLSVIVLGGICEILGWAGRAWSHYDLSNLNPFLIQQILLVLAPCFFSAFIYGVTGMMIKIIGPQYSRIKPNLYLWIFCSADLLAIVIQSIGGSKAAIALENNEGSASGTHIMVAGIAFQLALMVVFCVLIFDFLLKARRDLGSDTNKNRNKVNRLVAGIYIGSGLILLRCFYRTIELAQGWDGYLISNEGYFIGLDAVPMVLTMAIFIWAHPCYCLSPSTSSAGLNTQAETPVEKTQESNSSFDSSKLPV